MKKAIETAPVIEAFARNEQMTEGFIRRRIHHRILCKPLRPVGTPVPGCPQKHGAETKRTPREGCPYEDIGNCPVCGDIQETFAYAGKGNDTQVVPYIVGNGLCAIPVLCRGV